VSWLYTRKFLEVCNEEIYDRVWSVDIWGLGRLLEAPAFQNWCMDTVREYCKMPDREWPVLEVVDAIYKTSCKDSKFRKFAAHSMARESPFEKYEEGSEMYKSWNTLLKNSPDLGIDIALVAGKEWNGIYPWDDEHRQAYLEDEVDLDQRWEYQILAARSIEEIKVAAKSNCIRSILELAHIERKKGNN
jgi:hypothetical protein